MIEFDYKLFRRSCNQLGVLATTAGLIAYFVEPVIGLGDFYLVLIGVFLYSFGLMKWSRVEPIRGGGGSDG